MRSIAAVILLIALASPLGFGQVSSNVFSRVLHLRIGNETATGFTLPIDGREYLITAKHAVAHLGDQGVVGLDMNGTWMDLPVKIYRCDDPVDIAVLIPPYQLTVDYPLTSDWRDFLYGQEVYFLGFPYNLGGGLGRNGPYPLAFIKKALVSTFDPVYPQDQTNKETRLLFDGFNNPGFSGGPIVGRDANPGYPFSSNEFHVIGVVSGFIPDVVPIVSASKIASPDKASDRAKGQPWRITQKADGTYAEYVDTNDAAVLNTGIVIGYGLDAAVQLARKHPEGPIEKPLTEQRNMPPGWFAAPKK
jgi:hypothetical protein